MDKIKCIAHMTSVHPSHDIRIFHKECLSLVQHGYRVVLIAPHEGKETISNVEIYPIKKPFSRLLRFFCGSFQIYKAVRKINPDLCHFHDPELIFLGWVLSLQKYKVIYDVHENYAKAILIRNWIPKILRTLLSKITQWIECFFSKSFSYIITATPDISNIFKSTTKNIDVIYNYPDFSEYIQFDPSDDFSQRHSVCYIGNISQERGIYETIQSAYNAGVSLLLAGNFSEKKTEEHCVQLKEYACVTPFGYLNREQLSLCYKPSFAGIVLFHPCPHHINALPNKLFEYMAAGLPVIASSFPLWKDLIEQNECGLCVDPLDIDAIANAIVFLKNNPAIAKKMGEKGRRLIIEQYQWMIEEEKLLKIYQRIGL